MEKKAPKKQGKKSERELPDGYSQEEWDAEMTVFKERLRKLEQEGISLK
jgi:hypothetical protein